MDTEVGEMRVAMNWEFGVDTHTHTVCVLSCSVTSYSLSWTITHQAPLSMESSRREYQSRLPCTTPGGLPDKGLHPCPALRVDSLPPRAWEGRVGICGTTQGSLVLTQEGGGRLGGRGYMHPYSWFTDLMGMSLSKLWEEVKDRGARHAAAHGVAKSDMTQKQQQQQPYLIIHSHLMDIRAFPTFGYYESCCYEYSHTIFCVDIYLQFSQAYMFNFLRNCQTFSKLLHHFAIPSAM